AQAANAELIKHSKRTLQLPLFSVERTFVHLAELIAPHRDGGDVTLVPMGPKPHVLAAILLAMRFEEISCLRVSGRRSKAEGVGTTGAIVATRVSFKPGRAQLPWRKINR